MAFSDSVCESVKRELTRIKMNDFLRVTDSQSLQMLVFPLLCMFAFECGLNSGAEFEI